MTEPADQGATPEKGSEKWWEIVKLVYERAEENAYHDDVLMWEVTSIVWGANTLLLGFILEAISHSEALPLIIAVSIIGIFLTVFVFHFFLLGKIGQRSAYNLGHDIEQDFPEELRLHTRIRETYEKGVAPCELWGDRIGRARRWVVALTAVFLAGWLFVLGWAVWLQWFHDAGGKAILSGAQDSVAITVKRQRLPAWRSMRLFSRFSSPCLIRCLAIGLLGERSGGANHGCVHSCA
jgi:hypothetical protein